MMRQQSASAASSHRAFLSQARQPVSRGGIFCPHLMHVGPSGALAATASSNAATVAGGTRSCPRARRVSIEIVVALGRRSARVLRANLGGEVPRLLRTHSSTIASTSVPIATRHSVAGSLWRALAILVRNPRGTSSASSASSTRSSKPASRGSPADGASRIDLPRVLGSQLVDHNVGR